MAHVKTSIQIKALRMQIDKLVVEQSARGKKGQTEAKIKDFVPGKTVVLLREYVKSRQKDVRYRVVSVKRQSSYLHGGYTVGLRPIGGSKVSYRKGMSGQDYFWVESK